MINIIGDEIRALNRAKQQVKLCLDEDNYQEARNWIAEVIKHEAIIIREKEVLSTKNVIDIVATKTQEGTKFAWTTESFNKETGNMCQKFIKNYHQAIDFFPEVRKKWIKES